MSTGREELGCLVWVGVVAIVVWKLWDEPKLWPFGMSDEVTVHYVLCDGTVKEDGRCDGKDQAMHPITYKAVVERQTVVYWSWSDGIVEGYKNCEVRDSSNWSCAQSVGPNIRMIDGAIEDEFGGNPRTVPAWRWWLIHWLTGSPRESGGKDGWTIERVQ